MFFEDIIKFLIILYWLLLIGAFSGFFILLYMFFKKSSWGRIWPAGRTLEAPALNQHNLCFTDGRFRDGKTGGQVVIAVEICKIRFI